MDFGGASRDLHALTRLLAAAGLVVLLALALTAGAARAQAQAPPPETPAYDEVVDDDHGNDPGRPGENGPRPQAPGLLIPANPGAADGWELPEQDELPDVTSAYVAGRDARMRTDGKAAIPRGAPKRIRSLIAQYNRIVGKRYKWGGGHARLVDSGYDCSGAVGYGLIRAGLLSSPLVSGGFARWGAAGAGRWVTVYAHRSHVYVEIAGLRLDTSPVGDRAGRGGVRWRPIIGQRRGFKVRHPVGL